MLHTAESAANPERPISAGDLVVVYEGFESMKAVRVTDGGNYNNKYGSFAHKVMTACSAVVSAFVASFRRTSSLQTAVSGMHAHSSVSLSSAAAAACGVVHSRPLVPLLAALPCALLVTCPSAFHAPVIVPSRTRTGSGAPLAARWCRARAAAGCCCWRPARSCGRTCCATARRSCTPPTSPWWWPCWSCAQGRWCWRAAPAAAA